MTEYEHSQRENDAVDGVVHAPLTAAEDLQIAKDEYRSLRRGVLWVLGFSCASLLAMNIVDPDLWGHVTYGRELLADGELPQYATHTYTAKDHPWINHENLAEIWLTLTFDHLGVAGLLVSKLLLGLSILGMMFATARRRGVDPAITAGVLLLVALNLQAFFPLRPQLLSFFWCAVMLLLVERGFAHWGKFEINAKPLWLCLPILVLWVNSHGGFVAGLAIFLAMLGGRCVELYVAQPQQFAAKIKQLVAIGGCACFAPLVNPYGWRLPAWLIESLSRPRPEITEWARPTFAHPVMIPLLILAGAALFSVLLARRHRDWVKSALLLLVAWQAFTHLRHIAFFALLCGFWLPSWVGQIVQRIRQSRSDRPVVRLEPRPRKIAIATLAVAMLLQGWYLTSQLTKLPVDRARYPVDAFRYLAEQDLRGNAFVPFNWAQYAIAALPNIDVEFDGRFRTCYPQSEVDRHFDFLLGEHGGMRYRAPDSGPINPRSLLDDATPDLIVIDRNYKHARDVMQSENKTNAGRWVLLYLDQLAEVWGRAEVFGHADAPQFVAEENRVWLVEPLEGWVSWPAIPPQSIANQLSLQQPNTVHTWGDKEVAERRP